MSYNIKKVCETCGGDGVVTSTYPPGDHQCWRCDGDGTVTTCSLEGIDSTLADIMDRCNDILDKCNDILEKVSA